MNRRIVSIIVLALSLSLFGAILHFIGQNERLEHYYVSDDEWSEIISTRVRSEDMNTDFLRFNHENLFRTNDDVLFYSMIDDDVHAYNPKVQISGGLKIAVKGEHLSAEMVEQNQQLDLMIYNDEIFQIFKLTTTNLPLLSINYDGDAPTTRDDVEFSMKLYDNRKGALDRIVESDGKSHLRGSSSFSSLKSSYALKLTKESPGNSTRSNPMPLLGMRETNHWILKSMNYDFEKFRDYFAAKLWNDGLSTSNSFGIDNGFGFEFVELIENGTYSGLYLLGYRIDESVIASEDEEVDENHPDIMFKTKTDDNIYDFVTDQTDYLDSFELITDSVDRKTAYSTLKEYVKSLYGLDKEKLEYYTDYQNAMDFNIFINFTQNIDISRDAEGMYKNVYITFKWDKDHYRAVLMPWDFDMALGSNCLYGLQYNLEDDRNVILHTDYVAAMRRMGDNEVYRALANRYSELRQGTLSGNHIFSVVEDIENKVYNSGAHRRDTDRWPTNNHSDSDLKMDTFSDFIKRRIAYLDSYYDPYALSRQEESLSTGNLLSPNDPEYYEAKQPEEDYEENVYFDYNFLY